MDIMSSGNNLLKKKGKKGKKYLFVEKDNKLLDENIKLKTYL